MSGQMPRFAVLSLSRSGSTALYRIFSLEPRVRIEYEPDFEGVWRNPADLAAYCRSAFSRSRGIKHVWDPNGWPFAGKAHLSTLETLASSDEWIPVNAALANCLDRVLVLRRKDRLARALSDLLGQQTGLWGHSPDLPHSAREVADYRERLGSRALYALDAEVIDWYLRHGSAWEDRILAAVPAEKQRMVFYEDLFGPAVDLDERARRVVEIGNWLGVRVDPRDPRTRAILHPDSKINAWSDYQRITNIREIMSRFGAHPADAARVEERSLLP